VTVASGGIAGSIILSGNRLGRVIPLIILCMGVLFFTDEVEFYLTGERTFWTSPEGIGAVTLSTEQLDAIQGRKVAVGILSILLVSFGYAVVMRVVGIEGKERTTIETEMGIAASIQQSLLPPSTVRTSWCEVAFKMKSASDVGGDMVDVIEMRGGQIAVVVGDVSGHGIGPGMLSAMTKSALRGELVSLESRGMLTKASPSDILGNLNRTIHQVSDAKSFVTFAFVMVRRNKLVMDYSTAGHPPLFLLREGEMKELRTPNLALGLKEKGHFKHQVMMLEKGDRLLLYTDGILEAAGPDGGVYGSERLKLVFQKHASDSPELCCSSILQSVKDYRGDSMLEDDATVVVIQVL
jgi:sigma-B regulation protein RsbU (phosphoserine phosphatase)